MVVDNRVLYVRAFQRKMDCSVWELERLTKFICPFHYPAGLGSEKSRLSRHNKGTVVTSVRCTHKDNDMLSGTQAFGARPWRGALLFNILRKKHLLKFGHFAYFQCAPHSNARYCWYLQFWFILVRRVLFNRFHRRPRHHQS